MVSDEAPSSASEVPAAARLSGIDQTPRLGIIHFLAWITVAALFFKLDLAVGPATWSIDGLLTALFIVWTAAGVVGSASIAGARRRGLIARLAPGHWILIALVAPILNSLLVYLPVGCVIVLRGQGSWSSANQRILAIDIVNALVECAIFLVAAWRLRHQPVWAPLLVFCGLVSLAMLYLWYNLDPVVGFDCDVDRTVWVMVGASFLASTLMTVVTFRDLRRVRRDWLHALGVGLYVAGSALWITEALWEMWE